MSDVALARELAFPWKYFVLFVSIDNEKLTSSTGQPDAQTRDLRTAIERKQCHGDQLPFVSGSSVLRDGPMSTLVRSIVVVFIMKVDVGEAITTATALCCVSYDPSKFPRIVMSTAGFIFASGKHRYVATRLDGRRPVRQRPGAIVEQGRATETTVFPVDVFRTEDDHLTYAEEVGHVVCDWTNDYIDVVLIKLLDEDTPSAVYYTEEQVTHYMISLMKSIVHQDASILVHIHTASCLQEAFETGVIPGTIVDVRHITRGSVVRRRHIIVRLHEGYKIQPGQCGSAVTLVGDGRPVGMLVARFNNDDSIAVVTPLHHIYASLNTGLPAARKLQLYPRRGTVAAARLVSKIIKDGLVQCAVTRAACELERRRNISGPLQGCCMWHTTQANARIGRVNNPFARMPPPVPPVPLSRQFWNPVGSGSSGAPLRAYSTRLSAPSSGSIENLRDVNHLVHHLATPSSTTWHLLAKLLEPQLDSQGCVTNWTYPALICSWSVQPSCERVSAVHTHTHTATDQQTKPRPRQLLIATWCCFVSLSDMAANR